MTYKQLIDREFLSLTPTFDTLQQQLLVLSQSVPEGDVDLSLSSGKNSTFVFVFISGKREATIEFYRWHSTSQWMESLGILRDQCMNPPSYQPTQIEILTEQLESERLETARLRKIVKFMEQAL